MNEIDYLICDLDNTLLFHGKEYHEEDLQALKRWREKGKHLWIATGRSPGFMEEVRKHIYAEYMIANTGASITDRNGNVRTLWYISEDCARDLILLLDGLEGLDYRFVTDGNGLYGHFSAGALQPREGTADYRNVNDFLNQSEERLLRVFAGADREEICEETARAVEEHFEGILSAMETSERRLDIVPYGCDKWSTVTALLETLGIDPRKTAAIGDAETDRKMVEGAGIGFAMKNGHPVVRKAADRIVASVAEAAAYLLGEPESKWNSSENSSL